MAAAETTAWPVAAAASLAASTMGQHWLLLGVPPAVWFACVAGAIWGATWFEAHRPVARPIAVIANFGAGLVLSTGLDEYANLGTWAHATAGFVAAAWPVMIAQAVRDSIIGAIHKIGGREGGKQ